MERIIEGHVGGGNPAQQAVGHLWQEWLKVMDMKPEDGLKALTFGHYLLDNMGKYAELQLFYEEAVKAWKKKYPDR